jgi:hypothetical protein
VLHLYGETDTRREPLYRGSANEKDTMRTWLVLLVVALQGCELLQNNEQKEIITMIKFVSPDCSIYMQKSLGSDTSSFEGSVIELDDAFEIGGVEEPQDQP